MTFYRYMSNKHLQFMKQVEEAYSEEFLEKIYSRLSIEDEDNKKELREYAILNAVNFLDACEVSKNRIPLHKKKKILNQYGTALKKVKSQFQKIEECDPANSVFHTTLRDKIKNSSPEIAEMFHPYMQVQGSEYEFWSRSERLFHQFMDTLIDAATDAPDNILDQEGVDLTTSFILDWVILTMNRWHKFTDVTFGVGDWIKSNDDEKGFYKSVCVDVLFDLFTAIDEKITRAQIETALRKVIEKQ